MKKFAIALLACVIGFVLIVTVGFSNLEENTGEAIYESMANEAIMQNDDQTIIENRRYSIQTIAESSDRAQEDLQKS